MTKPSVLLVSYHFYPSGEVGAKRPSETAAYLAAKGYDVVVVKANSRGQPAVDEWPGFQSLVVVSVTVPRKLLTSLWKSCKSLLRANRGQQPADVAEVPNQSDAEVTSTAGNQVGWLRRQALAFDTLFQGDKLWILKVLLHLVRLRVTRRVDLVIASGPPMCGYICGLAASRLFGAKLVLDFRDPWYLHGDVERKTSSLGHPLANWENSFAQKCISRSSLITVASPGIHRHIDESFDTGASTVKLIRNGFDDAAVVADPAPTGSLQMLYAGSLYWNRNPFPFLSALAEVAGMETVDREAVHFTMVGHCDSWEGREIRPWLARHGLDRMVTILPPVDAVNLAGMTARHNVLINFAQGQPRQIPAKSYEYLAARRDLIVLCDEHGDVAELYREAGIGEIVNFDDISAIKSAILMFYNRYVAQQGGDGPAQIDIARYRRMTQIANFEECLAGIEVSRQQ